MKYTGWKLLLVVLVASALLPLGSFAQDKVEQSEKKPDSVLDNPGRLFDLKIPDGFKSENIEEPGIMRWKKGSAEILLTVGEIFQESGEVLCKAIEDAATKDNRFASAKTLPFENGRAIILKEKAPEPATRQQGWRFMVITDNKVFNIDFSAPAEEFDAFATDFEGVVKSFKLKTSS